MNNTHLRHDYCHCVMYEKNIESFNGIDCLLAVQHASGSEIYLRVATVSTNWGNGDTIDGDRCWIKSGSARGFCPAQSSNSVIERMGFKSWQYFNIGNLLRVILLINVSRICDHVIQIIFHMIMTYLNCRIFSFQIYPVRKGNSSTVMLVKSVVHLGNSSPLLNPQFL